MVHCIQDTAEPWSCVMANMAFHYLFSLFSLLIHNILFGFGH